jgi:hypothetical protein
MAASLDQARSAKSEAAKEFGRHGEVMGVGIVKAGDGYGLKINLKQLADDPAALPQSIQGVPTRCEVVGVIRKQSPTRA